MSYYIEQTINNKGDNCECYNFWWTRAHLT